MQTRPSPPIPSVTTPSNLTGLLGVPDHLFFDSTAPAPPPRGALARLPDDLVSTPMSLGSCRLCNDLPSGAASTLDPIAEQLARYDPPVACIEFGRVTIYQEPRRSNSGPHHPRLTDANLTRGRFNGYMSPATVRRVRRIVSTWTRAIWIYRRELKRRYDPGRAYPVFFTLTLSSDQIHPDATINRQCLQPFLQAMKRTHGIEHYFWRAESQENGRIHFHVLTDRYIPKEALRIAWNKAQNLLGYVDRYYEATGKADPPSTEIHRLRERVKDERTGRWRTVDPIEYLLDYLLDVARPEAPRPGQPIDPKAPPVLLGHGRAEDGTVTTYTTRPIQGRVWGMSDGMRVCREPRAHVDLPLAHALERGRQSKLLRRIDTEHATLFFGNVAAVLQRYVPRLLKLVKRYYMQVFGWLYPGQLPPAYVRARPPMSPVNLWLQPRDHLLTHRTVYTTDSPGFSTPEELLNWTRLNRPEHYCPALFNLPSPSLALAGSP